VVAFLPQHTPSKSRVMAIVDKGSGLEIDAIATVDWPHEAIALSNILNAADEGAQALSGLWAVLPSAVRANLEQASGQLAGPDDGRYGMSRLFVTTLDTPDLPPPVANIDWARLFPATSCPEQGCDRCTGCAAHATVRGESNASNQCGPGGSCSCVTGKPSADDELCECGFMVIGPRWAAAIYDNLVDLAERLIQRAQNLMRGIEEGNVGVPRSLSFQPPHFYLRLAATCADLCRELAAGREPVPHTIAEAIMLDEAATGTLEAHTGKDGLEIDALAAEWKHLPAAFGDFDLDALWMFQMLDDHWIDIAEAQEVFAPSTVDRIFDLIPSNAAEWPRPARAQ
jgi:hypothetical protein